MASTYLSETTLGTATDATKFTFSAWVKTSFVGAGGGNDYQLLLGSKPDHANSREGIWIWNNSELAFYNFASAGASAIVTRTSAKLKDVNGWYHIVVTGDASQSGTDKLKFYINGELQTAFDEDNRSNFVTIAHGIQDTSSAVEIGGYSGTSYYLDGYMSHVHFTDGYAYAASTFGSTDAVTGSWNINTSPSVTYGNNGFFLLKDGNSVTDQSGNSNNFTVAGGTLTNSEDCPSNNFATLNSLFTCQGQATTFSNGNTTGQSPNSQGCAGVSTLGASSGKFYAEFKQSAESTTNEGAIGVCDTYYINNNDNLGGSSNPGYIEYSVACFGLRDGSGGNFYSSNGSKVNNASGQHGNWVNGDIIMVAMDLDNNRVYFGKNGQWQNGTYWNSATPNTYITLDSTGFEGTYHFVVGDSSSGNNVTWQANFGNGYFGTTQITSAGTNASNNGIFEYDVPSGYTALSTKGLNL